MLFGRKINEDYAWELCGFHRVRSFDDGITFVEFVTNWDRYLADHTPRFEMSLTLFNYILEFSIYYRHHRDEENEL